MPVDMKPCPHCGTSNREQAPELERKEVLRGAAHHGEHGRSGGLRVVGGNESLWVLCECCYMSGPIASNNERAVEVWNLLPRAKRAGETE